MWTLQVLICDSSSLWHCLHGWLWLHYTILVVLPAHWSLLPFACFYCYPKSIKVCIQMPFFSLWYFPWSVLSIVFLSSTPWASTAPFPTSLPSASHSNPSQSVINWQILPEPLSHSRHCQMLGVEQSTSQMWPRQCRVEKTYVQQVNNLVNPTPHLLGEHRARSYNLAWELQNAVSEAETRKMSGHRPVEWEQKTFQLRESMCEDTEAGTNMAYWRSWETVMAVEKNTK